MKSFYDLIREKEIIIPKIQRDYVQGRQETSVAEIRESFVSSIVDTLIQNNKEKKLVLDFIYGSDEGSYFFPLDGQQRLTTLFLFHWYLSDNCDFLRIRGEVVRSRFTYHVRTSSKQFCDELVNHNSSELIEKSDNYDAGGFKDKKKRLSETIKNESWFLWEWNKDPTIQAMLTMLDSIHCKIEGMKKECMILRKDLFARLKERVVFNLLPLDEYGFKDELYVKMNSRGKPLSNFDILKSTLEEQMRKTCVPEEIRLHWQNEFDNTWLSFFWNQFAKPNIVLKKALEATEELDFNNLESSVVHEVEDRFLRFLLRCITSYIFEAQFDFSMVNWDDNDVRIWMPENSEFEQISSNNAESIIRKHSINNISELIPLFCKIKFFNECFFAYLIDILDSLIINQDDGVSNGSMLLEESGIWFERNDSNPAQNLFEAFTNENVTYEIRIQFAALWKFFKHTSSSICFKDSLSKKNELFSWMRIIRNLTTISNNTHRIDSHEDFGDVLSKTNELISSIYGDASSSVNEYFENTSIDRFFSEEQWKEERLKVILFKESGWEDLIKRAENHKYLTGQIRFLLDWSRVDENTYDKGAFIRYYNRFTELFDENGIKEEMASSQLFTSLMLKKYSTEYCYRGNSQEDMLYCLVNNTGKDRDYSWKNYLRFNVYSQWIKKLFDEEPDLSLGRCKAIIAGKTGDWRDYYACVPLSDYEWINRNRKITFFDDERTIVKIVSKKRSDSYSYELMTTYLWFSYNGYSDGKDSYKELFHSHYVNNKYSVKFYLNQNAEKYVMVCYREGNFDYRIETNFDAQNYGLNLVDNHWELISADFSVIEQKLKDVLAITEKASS